MPISKALSSLIFSIIINSRRAFHLIVPVKPKNKGIRDSGGRFFLAGQALTIGLSLHDIIIGVTGSGPSFAFHKRGIY
jgi:hypothetical protein